jgi:hypothetical protein
MTRRIDRITVSQGRPWGGRGALAAAALLLGGCSMARRVNPCEDGVLVACETPCGPGLQSCDEEGYWTPCVPTEAVDCLPGETGACELGEGGPPGRWACSDDCRLGPCEPACEPGTQVECEGECGRGAWYCSAEGTWSDCIPYLAPPCRDGEIEACAGGGLTRCVACAIGPCEVETSCTPGEVAHDPACGYYDCGPDGTWIGCPPCSPGELEGCPGRGYCGMQFRYCTESGTWSECVEFWEIPHE